MNQTNRPKLCFVSLYNYPLFNPACQGIFGGGEVRSALIARELARRDRFEVSMVVFDHGQPKVEQREGITFYAHPAYRAALHTLPQGRVSSNNNRASTAILNWRQRLTHQLKRRFHRLPPGFYNWARWLYHLLRWLRLSIARKNAGRIGLYVIEPSKIAIYDQVGADIYLFPGLSYVAAELAFYCRQKGKKYVFLAGSDQDYYPTFKERLQANDVTALPWVYAINQATAHITQSAAQAGLLRQHYGRIAPVVRNPLDLRREFSRHPQASTILWIGRSDKIKRPEIMLELARRCPQFQFTLIMTLWRQDIFAACLAQAQKLPNVTMLNYVPYPQVERYFAQARLFVNTSAFEGFPNAFLQAAKYQTPIVSLQVDPGQMLSQHGCGLCCHGNLGQLVQHIQDLMTNSARHAHISSRCLDYVQTYHDKEKIIPQYEQILGNILTCAHARYDEVLTGAPDEARLADVRH